MRLLRGTDWIFKYQLVWFSSFKAYVSNWRVNCCLWAALLIRVYKIATERLVCGCETWFFSPCKVTSHRQGFLKGVVLRGGLETERKEAMGDWRENYIWGAAGCYCWRNLRVRRSGQWDAWGYKRSIIILWEHPKGRHQLGTEARMGDDIKTNLWMECGVSASCVSDMEQPLALVNWAMYPGNSLSSWEV